MALITHKMAVVAKVTSKKKKSMARGADASSISSLVNLKGGKKKDLALYNR